MTRANNIFSYSSTFLYLQTLTTLDLYSNKIEDIGAQYLADVLRTNSVRNSHPSFILYLLIYLDSHYTDTSA